MAQLWGDAIKDGQGYHNPGLSEPQYRFAAGNRRDGVTDLFQVTVEGRCSRRHNFPCFLLDTNISNVVSPMTFHSTTNQPWSILPTPPATPAWEDAGRWLANRLNPEDPWLFLNLKPRHRPYQWSTDKEPNHCVSLPARVICAALSPDGVLPNEPAPKFSSQANALHPSQGRSGSHPCRFMDFAFPIWFPAYCF